MAKRERIWILKSDDGEIETASTDLSLIKTRLTEKIGEKQIKFVEGNENFEPKIIYVFVLYSDGESEYGMIVGVLETQ